MVKELNILYGFRYKKGENEITKAIESYGVIVNGAMRYSKLSIKGFLQNTPETDVVILKEYLEGGESYSPSELAELADETGARFIVLLHPKNRGRETMRSLYIAGILDAVFSDKRTGIAPETLAQLVIKGRTRKDAREYYRIYDVEWPDYGVVSKEECISAINFLEGREDSGRDIAERFYDLSKAFTKRQFGKFVREIPQEDIQALQRYEIFYDIMEDLRRSGFTSMRFKKPHDVIKTLPEEIVGEARRRFEAQGYVRTKRAEPVIESVKIEDDLSDGAIAYPEKQDRRSRRQKRARAAAESPESFNGGENEPQNHKMLYDDNEGETTKVYNNKERKSVTVVMETDNITQNDDFTQRRENTRYGGTDEGTLSSMNVEDLIAQYQ